MTMIVELRDKVGIGGAHDIHLGQAIRSYELKKHSYVKLSSILDDYLPE